MLWKKSATFYVPGLFKAVLRAVQPGQGPT